MYVAVQEVYVPPGAREATEQLRLGNIGSVILTFVSVTFPVFVTVKV